LGGHIKNPAPAGATPRRAWRQDYTNYSKTDSSSGLDESFTGTALPALSPLRGERIPRRVSRIDPLNPCAPFLLSLLHTLVEERDGERRFCLRFWFMERVRVRASDFPRLF
jgi:hypothetical protein